MADWTVPLPRAAADTSSLKSERSSTSTSPSVLLRSSAAASPVSSSLASPHAHQRRPSLTMPPLSLQTSPIPLPVPHRHGSFHGHGASPEWAPVSPRARASAGVSPASPQAHDRLARAHAYPHTHAHTHSHAHGHGHGMHSRTASAASPGSTSLPASMYLVSEAAPDDDSWLDIAAHEIMATAAEEASVPVVDGSVGVEEAVEILLKDDHPCLLVRHDASSAFFDHADLNTFLLLVLQASSVGPDGDDAQLDLRARDVVRRLRAGVRFGVEAVCDISQKNPYHAFPPSVTIRTLLPLFSSGLHRVAILTSPPTVLTSSALLTHLLALPPARTPALLSRSISASSIPLHPLISLPGTASVLDAMQVMSLSGLNAVGVLSGPGGSRHRRGSSASRSSTGSSGSAGLAAGATARDYLSATGTAGAPVTEVLDLPPQNDLVGIVTVHDCARLVVPSEGRQVLGMGLERMCKAIQVVDEPGRERGEERIPVHTVTHAQTLLHVAHLLFATSSSRVLLRLNPGVSPPLSPVPSLSLSATSPASSPSISSLSLQDEPPSPQARVAALPRPPATLLSPHSVISVLDVLACLARAYRSSLGPSTGPVQPAAGRPEGLQIDTGLGDVFTDQPAFGLSAGSLSTSPATQEWDLDPESMAKRRRASSGAGSRVAGFENWRWARSVRN
ncbi:hypothetical protein Q5752_001587 [Cryptotrichosporon argae]